MGLEERRPTYYCSPKAKKGDKIDPHIQITFIDSNGSKEELKPYNKISGFLICLDHGEYEWPKNSGKKVKTISLWMEDGEDLFKVEMSINTNMARSMMNTIAGTLYFESKMYISVFKSKEGYPNIHISNGGDQCQWRFDYLTELKPLIKYVDDPQNAGKQIPVYHEVNNKLWDAWLEAEPVVAAFAKENGRSIESASTVKAPEASSQPQPANGSQSQPTQHVSPGPGVVEYPYGPDNSFVDPGADDDDGPPF